MLAAYRDALFERLVVEHATLEKRKTKIKDELLNRGSLSEKSEAMFAVSDSTCPLAFCLVLLSSSLPC